MTTRLYSIYLVSEASRRHNARVLRMKLHSPRRSRVTLQGLYHLALQKASDFDCVIAVGRGEHFPAGKRRVGSTTVDRWLDVGWGSSSTQQKTDKLFCHNLAYFFHILNIAHLWVLNLPELLDEESESCFSVFPRHMQY